MGALGREIGRHVVSQVIENRVRFVASVREGRLSSSAQGFQHLGRSQPDESGPTPDFEYPKWIGIQLVAAAAAAGEEIARAGRQQARKERRGSPRAVTRRRFELRPVAEGELERRQRRRTIARGDDGGRSSWWRSRIERRRGGRRSEPFRDDAGWRFWFILSGWRFWFTL